MINQKLSECICTGCFACVNICKTNAIHMEKRKNGFKYPLVDINKCINCNQCLKVCGSTKSRPIDLLDFPLVYAMRSKDDNIRLHSTSGGIFSELAEYVLRRNGNVVGAVYNSDWSVEHCMIQDIEDLENLRRSKYQQSDINMLYREVRAALNEQKEVLFCGTPCQIGGLKGFLRKEYDSLYTCDFICRGVSSPKLFAKYIEDLKYEYGSDIEYVWMKNKCNGWHDLTTVIGFQNGGKYTKKGLDDSYVQMYLKYNAGIRESCYDCQFKGEADVSDITLGDFWGLDGTALDDNLGTSVVICRTQKGRKLVNEIKEKVIYQRRPIEDVEKGNPCLYKNVEIKGRDIEKFYDILESEGYQQAYRWIAKEKHE